MVSISGEAIAYDFRVNRGPTLFGVVEFL